jgi:hypothetical protein
MFELADAVLCADGPVRSLAEHAVCQKPMPDARYATQFWTGVADAFKGNDAVVFDLFNEPYPDMPAEWNKTLGWQCLRDGGTCTGIRSAS